MEGVGSLNSMDQKGKAKVAMYMTSEETQEPSLIKGSKVFEEEIPERESTIVACYAGENTSRTAEACYAGENKPQTVVECYARKNTPQNVVTCDAGENSPLENQPSPMGLVNYGGDYATGSASMSVPNMSPRVVNDGGTSRDKSISYQCKYCESRFATSQALGGHQNTHKYVREQAKKQKVRRQHKPSNSILKQPRVIYPKPPLYNYNNFTLPRPPYMHPQSMPGYLTKQYNPQSTTGMTFSPPGQSSNMSSNTRQFPVFNSSTMIVSNSTIHAVNANYTSGNYFNFRGTMVGDQGDNYIRGGSYIGRGYTNVRGHDGTIDLLSRVGMCSEEDANSNGKGQS
ncbi:hypothetical protein QVD17_41221 [Tagetes erecta]|uniref:C2H2-type domain-containing protein n=1 Tax=Tagetes erecta TaxID=13708 RepID=A0AAD8JSB1_TARER|nr:hypothetical protein QVD17_41221 [Tagetes erecta]